MRPLTMKIFGLMLFLLAIAFNVYSFCTASSTIFVLTSALMLFVFVGSYYEVSFYKNLIQNNLKNVIKTSFFIVYFSKVHIFIFTKLEFIYGMKALINKIIGEIKWNLLEPR